MDELWQMERDFWLKGIEHFDKNLANECLIVLPGVGILDRQQVLESLGQAPRWAGVEMRGEREAVVGEAAVVLAYDATGHRDGADPYRANCTSTYSLDRHRTWRMVQHQQTLVA